MTKVAVVFADGCEEVEGLSVVDVLRRLNIECDMVGLDKLKINGDHKIILTCDKVVDDSLLDYDLVAFPGGKTGATNLRDNEKLAKLMIERHKQGKWDAAMCAAPIALGRYGVLKDSNFTCYPGFEKEILQDCPSANFKTDITVTDNEHKIITSRGPATAWAYAYAIAQALGVDTQALKAGMLYDYLASHIQESL
ncbi:DJ-1 family glyoxalase III [uncultured Lactobacillus sp.]|uniref:DJ-1 family glyoxalase III n=1 Tax=uncultured Lactobacillus sp. TaxID=153152 RepID=UPI0026291075|nr:DJ-1 family glyoxalase III [uncultured Lactobacillus sp.]